MIVDFSCPRCNRLLEREFGIGEPPRCLECGVDMLRKYGVGGVFFKGSGFAKNDKKT